MGKPAPAAVSCPDCQKKFPDLPHLHDHMGAQMAKGNGHTHCKECKKYFQEVEDLIAHVKEVITPKPTNFCGMLTDYATGTHQTDGLDLSRLSAPLRQHWRDSAAH